MGELHRIRLKAETFHAYLDEGFIELHLGRPRQGIAAYGWFGRPRAGGGVDWRFRDLTREPKVVIATRIACWRGWMFDPGTAYRYAQWWRTGRGLCPSMAEMVAA